MAAQGWRTSDAQELALRRLRAQAEPMAVRQLTPGHPCFADFSVQRTDQPQAQTYVVELRSLTERVNYCTCPDFTKNSLGTCKHIEKVLLELPRRPDEPGASPFAEVFMGRSAEYRPQLVPPPRPAPALARFLGRYVDAQGDLKLPWQTTLQVLLRDLRDAEPALACQLRVSREVYQLADELQRREERAAARARFEQDVLAGKRSVQLLTLPLYDYQVKGMMHLAFAGRALLADELGLGKTLQALAAATLMRELWGIRRVLVIAPAALLPAWAAHIRRCTRDAAVLVTGNQAERLRLYDRCTEFYCLLTYEQVLRDEAALNTTLRPDLIILDEAQRIRNWQTQTAQSIKRLQSQYAFVLTGAACDERLDECYSLVEFVNPRIFGSLFRFNRDFYQLDEHGRVTGHKNVREFQERLRPVFLRRRRRDLLDQLPARLDNHYYVPLAPEQRRRYAEQEQRLATLAHQARQQPLTAELAAQLFGELTQLRQLCASPYLLDAEATDAPKLDELLRVLDDVWDNQPQRKVVVCTAWPRLLELVRQRLDRAAIASAWHPQAAPSQPPPAELERFRTDPACRILLTTDAAARGLNLQAASVLVNLDYPWHAADEQQRLAGLWRRQQKSIVSVLHLIAEDTLEHRLLAAAPQPPPLPGQLPPSPEDLDLPAGRAAFLQRLLPLLPAPAEPPPAPATEPPPPAPPPVTPAERFRQDLLVALGPELLLLRAASDDRQRLTRGLAVVASDPVALRPQLLDLLRKSHGAEAPLPELHLLTAADYALLQRLALAGLIAFPEPPLPELYRAPAFMPPATDPAAAAARRRLADPLLAWAERQLRLAQVLAEGGFALDALPALRDATDHAARALAVLCLAEPLARAPDTFSDAWLRPIRDQHLLTPDLAQLLATYRTATPDSDAAARHLLAHVQHLVALAQSLHTRLSL